MSANCLLVELLLCQSFNYKQVEELGLLVTVLVVGASSQLELLSVEMILGLGTGKTVWQD